MVFMHGLFFTPKYIPVSKSEEENLNLNAVSKQPTPPIWQSSTPWIFLTVLFASLSTFLLLADRKALERELVDTGFVTDFRPARSQIETQRIKFTGTAMFDENGTAYRLSSGETPQYVGWPSEEIDIAWNALIKGRYFFVTDEEAEDAWGSNYREYYNHPGKGYTAGLDVFHTLHCVNQLRRNIDADYYFPNEPMTNFRRYHIDHCVDLVRQSIMCHGDLTPIPTRWFDGIQRDFIDSNQVHTCRNIEKLRNWTTERYNGSLAVHVATGS